MAGKMPQGLVGVLKGKNFVQAKKSKKKELPPALAAAAKRRMSSPPVPMGPSDNDADDYPMK